MIQYVGGLIELRDLSEQSDAILSFQVPHEEDDNMMHIVDIDLKGDESNLVIAFSTHRVAWLNLRTGEFQVQNQIIGWDGYIGRMLLQASFMQSLPGRNLFVHTREGSTYAVNENMDWEAFSQNLMVNGPVEQWRPFSKAIELKDSNNRLRTV